MICDSINELFLQPSFTTAWNHYLLFDLITIMLLAHILLIDFRNIVTIYALEKVQIKTKLYSPLHRFILCTCVCDLAT